MVNHKEILRLKSLGLTHREIADAAGCGRHAPFRRNGCTIPAVMMHHHLRSSCTFGAAYAQGNGLIYVAFIQVSSLY